MRSKGLEKVILMFAALFGLTCGLPMRSDAAAPEATPPPKRPPAFPDGLRIWLEAPQGTWFLPLLFKNAMFVLQCESEERNTCVAKRAYQNTPAGLVDAPEVLRGLSLGGKSRWYLKQEFGRFPDDAWAMAQSSDGEQRALLHYRASRWRIIQSFEKNASVPWLERWQGGVVAALSLSNNTEIFIGFNPVKPMRFPTAEMPPKAESTPAAYDKPQFIPHLFSDGTLAAVYHFREWDGVGLWAWKPGDALPRTALYPSLIYADGPRFGRVVWTATHSVTIEAFGQLPNESASESISGTQITAKLTEAGWQLTNQHYLAGKEREAFETYLNGGIVSHWADQLSAVSCDASQARTESEAYYGTVECWEAGRSYFVSTVQPGLRSIK